MYRSSSSRKWSFNSGWNDGWIEKLKEDQWEAKADIAAIVSTVLPKDASGIIQMGGLDC